MFKKRIACFVFKTGGIKLHSFFVYLSQGCVRLLQRGPVRMIPGASLQGDEGELRLRAAAQQRLRVAAVHGVLLALRNPAECASPMGSHAAPPIARLFVQNGLPGALLGITEYDTRRGLVSFFKTKKYTRANKTRDSSSTFSIPRRVF